MCIRDSPLGPGCAAADGAGPAVRAPAQDAPPGWRPPRRPLRLPRRQAEPQFGCGGADRQADPALVGCHRRR
eukprot:7940873-Alexandrium_andersonii.AAC.1